MTEKRVFVLYHEHYDKLPHTEDILDTNPNDDIKLEKTKSPFSIFILNENHELEIFAIQIDSSKKGMEDDSFNQIILQKFILLSTCRECTNIQKMYL